MLGWVWAFVNYLRNWMKWNDFSFESFHSGKTLLCPFPFSLFYRLSLFPIKLLFVPSCIHVEKFMKSIYELYYFFRIQTHFWWATTLWLCDQPIHLCLQFGLDTYLHSCSHMERSLWLFVCFSLCRFENYWMIENYNVCD